MDIYKNIILVHGHEIQEYMGVYYENDVENPGNNIPESNKDKKRVVTYLLK